MASFATAFPNIRDVSAMAVYYRCLDEEYTVQPLALMRVLSFMSFRFVSTGATSPCVRVDAPFGGSPCNG